MSPFRTTVDAARGREDLGTSFGIPLAVRLGSLLGSGEGGLFTSAEVQRLMRIEFDRAQRYHYPLACLLMAVDRLERLQDFHGLELKAAILERVGQLLRSEIRSSDLLGCLLEDRLLVMLPHSPREGVDKLAKRLLEGARKLQFESDGRLVRVSLSIGGSHNQNAKELYYETLVQVAEGGLAVSLASGGNRFVHTELYEHFQRKLDRDRKLHPDPGAASASPGTEGSEPAREPRQILAVNGAGSDEAGGGALLEAKLQEAHAEREMMLRIRETEHRQQLEILERRIAKLTQLLEKTEEDLKRIAALKSIDPGIASIYRSVQGLSSEEEALALKKELMQKIFQANLELKQTIAHQP